MIANAFGETVYDADTNLENENDFWSTLNLAVTILVTDVGILFALLDRRIIKVLSMQYLEEELSDESGGDNQVEDPEELQMLQQEQSFSDRNTIKNDTFVEPFLDATSPRTRNHDSNRNRKDSSFTDYEDKGLDNS